MLESSQVATAPSDRLRTFCITFAAIGAAVLLYQVIGYLRWLTGPTFAAVAPGPTPIPDEVLAAVRSTETRQVTGAVVWTLFLVGLAIWRRRLVWPIAATIVWSSIYWQEPILNAGNQAFSFNLHFFNRGDWISALPFVSTDGPMMTQPLKMEASAFYWLIPVMSAICAGVLLAARRYLKITSTIVLCLIAAVLGFALDAYAELVGISQGVIVWNRAWAPLTIYAGTQMQWPIYEGVLLGGLWILLGAFYHFRGANRFSPWDHGLAHVSSPRLRTVATVLMLIGLMNVLFIIYNFIVVGFSVISPELPGLPSYLGGGIG